MISIEVKTIWQGKVGIRDRYVKEATGKREGLLIIHGKDKMVIPFKKLKESIVGKSERRFVDQAGRDSPHYLIYFHWDPGVKQGSLF